MNIESEHSLSCNENMSSGVLVVSNGILCKYLVTLFWFMYMVMSTLHLPLRLYGYWRK